jgi:CheY-like chemotaxis protein
MSGKANSPAHPDVLVAVDDLFFFAKIEAAAKAVGTSLLQASEPCQFRTLLAGFVPRLIIFDLNSRAFDSLDAVRHIRTDTRFAQTRVIGFYSHVEMELRRAAEEAGCDQVLPRSAFVAQIRLLLK